MYSRIVYMATLQLTPEQRNALQSNPGEPVHIQDESTRKSYLLIEEGILPSLDEDYVRSGLEAARAQISRGQVSERPIQEVVAEAKQRHSA